MKLLGTYSIIIGNCLWQESFSEDEMCLPQDMIHLESTKSLNDLAIDTSKTVQAKLIKKNGSKNFLIRSEKTSLPENIRKEVTDYANAITGDYREKEDKFLSYALKHEGL